ncbi:MAG: acyltransferase family protein, partial [Micromonosporaceae bacterium]
VVLWHWVFAVTHRHHGVLVNPNPIEQVPGGWLLTWLFQVVPLFFIVGGYANLAAWDAVRRAGAGGRGGARGGAGRFLRQRLRRLLLPALVFAAVWTLLDSAVRLANPGHPGVLSTVPVVFTPLWFIAAYLMVVLLTPVTAAAQRRHGWGVAAGLGAAVVAADIGRLGFGLEWCGAVNTVLVWIFAHQLGYLWRDGETAPLWRRAALACGGVAGVALATSLGPYPPSLVATPDQDMSHMLPTTAVIASLAVFQLGLSTLLAPALSAWLRRRGPWRAVVAANAVVLTVFLWHMTALLAVFLVVEQLGFTPYSTATWQWWLQRPFWLVAPAAALVPLVLAFAPVERKSSTK